MDEKHAYATYATYATLPISCVFLVSLQFNNNSHNVRISALKLYSQKILHKLS